MNSLNDISDLNIYFSNKYGASLLHTESEDIPMKCRDEISFYVDMDVKY